MTSASLRYIALHAVAAAAFGLLLNHLALGATTEMSIAVAAAFAAAAVMLALYQTRR